MATKARQQYFADEDSLQKIRREFSIADDIQQKIDSIEEGAQVNVIETVKVNGTPLIPDANKAVNVEVPEVIDNLYTIDSDNALSAKQGKLLYDYIQNIASRGRFLSNWNSATGLPMTNPSESPYPYKSGDYFVVSNVAGLGGTNYRPDGSSYIIGQASTVVETESVDVSDFYFYDGTTWLLLKNSSRSGAVDSSLSTTSTNPVENRVITQALNGKQDTLIAGTNIQIAADGKTISATDTTYTAGTGINIDANNVISNTQTSAEWGNITGTLSNQTDLQNALNNKANKTDVLEKTNTTSYTPSADYNPATKKYVDDNKGAGIEYVTQAEYNALLPGAASDGKHYFIYTSSTPPFTPGVNTIAYFPFSDDMLDHSGNGVTLSGSGTKSTIGYTFNVSTGFTNSNIKFISTWLYVNSIGSGGQDSYDVLPVACMGYCAWNIFHMTPSLNDEIVVFIDSSFTVGGAVPGPSKQAWHHLCLGYDGTKIIVAIDGNVQTLYNGTPYNFGNSFYINHSRTTGDSTTFSETIIESECWTTQEIQDYFNATKANYGIS